MLRPASAFRALMAIFVILVVYVCTCNSHPYGNHLSDVSYIREGDINLGGLIPLRLYDASTQSCGALRDLGSLKRVEGMVYTIDRINADPTLLPNAKLGFEIRDTCSNTAAALGESLNFVSSDSCCADEQMCLSKKFVGVVGAQRSSSSKQAAILFGLHHMPQVSFLSTSDELGNHKTYPNFLRVVGPDSFQVRAMIDIILRYKWKYISFLNSDDTYGKSAQQQFTTLAKENDICVGITRTISLVASEKEFDEVMEELLELQEDSPAKVVILFTQLQMAQSIFSTATKMDAKRRFIWIGSDGWGNYGDQATQGNEEVSVGAFTIIPSSDTLPEFHSYFRSLTPATSDNPWLPQFLIHHDVCSNDTTCANSNLSDRDSDETSHETLVMDAVFAFAHALDSMCRDQCGEAVTDCAACFNTSTDFNREELVTQLLSAEFESLANGRVRFEDNGDSSGRYLIRNFQKVADSDSSVHYKFVTVGEWNDEITSNNVITEDVPWYMEVNNATGAPISVCSLPCEPGERREVNPDNPCCWHCLKCREFEIVTHNGTECSSCIILEEDQYGRPNEDFTECVDIKVARNNWAAAIITISVFGILFAIVVASLYVHHREKALIKASSRELSYVMFVGIFLAYITALLFGVFRLTTGVCVMHRLGPPIATSLIYVSLAMKTIRLYRIFRASMKSVKRPHFISPAFQIVITVVITAIPTAWVILWMVSDALPKVTEELPDGHSRYLQIACILSSGETIGVMVWNIFIILVCCTFAFLTRKLPENYNETKFIMFCSFCSLVVLLAFSTTYFTVGDAYYRSGYSSLGLIVNATVTLLCLYAIKIYAVYFVKAEDQHALRMSSRSKSVGGSTSFNKSFTSFPQTSITDVEGKRNSGGFAPESANGIQQEKSSGIGSSSSHQETIHEADEDEYLKQHKSDEDPGSNPSPPDPSSNPSPPARRKRPNKPQVRVSNNVDVLPENRESSTKKQNLHGSESDNEPTGGRQYDGNSNSKPGKEQEINTDSDCYTKEEMV